MPTAAAKRAKKASRPAVATAATRPQPQRRGQGRPSQRNGVGRASILDATAELLRRVAPGALTLKEVALQAGVDAALIRYYFVDKNGLLRETVAHMLELRQERSRELLRQGWSPARRLRERIATVLTQQCTDPNFHRLVVEHLFSSPDEASQKMVEAIAARGHALEVGLLQSANGGLRAVDPRFLNICILGVCEFFASSQPLISAMFGRPVDEPMTRSYVDFLVDVLLNGLAATKRQKVPG